MSHKLQAQATRAPSVRADWFGKSGTAWSASKVAVSAAALTVGAFVLRSVYRSRSDGRRILGSIHHDSLEMAASIKSANEQLNREINESSIIHSCRLKDHSSVEVIYIYRWEDCERVMKELLLSKPVVVGFDGEWGSVRKQSKNKNKKQSDEKSSDSSSVRSKKKQKQHSTTAQDLAVLQICTDSCILVIQLSRFMRTRFVNSNIDDHSFHPKLPPSLAALLSDPSIVKCGVGIKTDAQMIRKTFNTTLLSFLDLRYLVCDDNEFRSDIEMKCESNLITPADVRSNLKRLSQLYCDITLLKGYHSPQCSDWESWPLSSEQLSYAAMDAFVSLVVAISCFQRRKMIKLKKTKTKDAIAKDVVCLLTSSEISSYLKPYQRHLGRDFKPPLWFSKALNQANSSSKRRNHRKMQLSESMNNNNEVCNELILPSLAESSKSSSSNSGGGGGHSLVLSQYDKDHDRWRFLMVGPDSRFISKIQRNKAMFYLKNGMAILSHFDLKKRQCVIQISWTLERYGHPGTDHYLMSRCAGCNLSGITTDLIRHQIIPREYRKWMPEFVQIGLSHDVLPLCLDCKQLAEQHNAKYRRDVVSPRYYQGMQQGLMADGRFSDDANGKQPLLSEKQRSILGKNAYILEKNRPKLPQRRIDELEKPLKEYFDCDEITDEHLGLARTIPNQRKHADVVCELVLRDHRSLYDFIVGWRVHFIETLAPLNVSPIWLDKANEQLASLLGLDQEPGPESIVST